MLKASKKRDTYLKYADMHCMEEELKDYDGSVGTHSST